MGESLARGHEPISDQQGWRQRNRFCWGNEVSSQFAITLTPNSFDLRPKAITISEDAWKTAIGIVERSGYKPNLVGGMDRRTTMEFVRHLRLATERGTVSEQGRKTIDDLLGFLCGAGAGGFALSRGFKKWNQE